MTASQRAAELRAQADALESLNALEEVLAEAKAAFAADPCAETRAIKQEAALALREARALVRADRTAMVGGDAFISGSGD